MKTVKEIEVAIKDLPREEFMALANIIAAHQATLWEEDDDTDNADSLEFLYEDEEEETEHEEELEYTDF
ncbi:MAG: hypothetical protein H8E27_04415 [Verrucomicrobia subdivision 3 bacterium]|nr:hypothetical protein [Limisphaerales bacterium]